MLRRRRSVVNRVDAADTPNVDPLPVWIRVRVGHLIPALFAALAAALPASDGQAPPWVGPILPPNEPFTLNSYDFIDAVAMIRRARKLLYWDHSTRPRIVPVRRVESVPVAFDSQAWENHQHRYDILLNGEPIDWDRLYIEYAGDMINLRMLYTYRNQQPPPDLPYRLRWP